jgi:hypothetical protein
MTLTKKTLYMKIFSSYIKVMAIIITSVIFFQGCKKEDVLVTPPALVHFAGKSAGEYFITSSGAAYKIPIGVTSSSNQDREVTLSFESPTGAQEGVEYTAPVSVTITAGEIIDSISISGLFDAYPEGRVDTLIITITGGDILPLESNNTFTLVLQKFCDIVLDDFLGDFNNCFDLVDNVQVYGPYGVTVTSTVTNPDGVSGYLIMENFWDVGGTPTKIDLDWSSSGAFTTSLEDQFLYTDPTYGDARIRSFGTGTFSACSQSLLISYEVYIPGLGTFGNFTTTVER